MMRENKDSGAQQILGELRYPAGEEGPAYLSLWRDGQKLGTVELKARVARVLVVLSESRARDAAIEIDAAAQGWRTREQLAGLIEQRTQWPLSKLAVTAYVGMLGNALLELPLIDDECLIERRRRLGMRIAPHFRLFIVDSSNESGKDEPLRETSS